MRHLRYMQTMGTVCENPELLGVLEVHADLFSPDYPQICEDCSSLLYAYSKKKFEQNLREKTGAARGLVFGVVMASFVWLIFSLIVVWVIYHA